MGPHTVTDATGPGPVVIIALLLAISLLLLIIGLVLRSRGKFTSRRFAWAWGVITILPLFIGGAALMLKGQSRASLGPPTAGATGETGNLNNLQ